MMGGMDDLVAFLRARLDEDQQAAEAAAKERGADWRYDGHAVLASREDDLVAKGSQDFLERELADHIARHDPARVLRQVAGIRAIVDKYAEVASLYKREFPRVMTNARLEATHSAWESAVRGVATIWSGHPDYREDWRL